MKTMIYLLILVLLALNCQAQGIQEKVVMGFKSGLMNSIANDLMPEDAALELDDFDITEIGELTRRKGFTHHFVDDWTGSKVDHLISFHSSDGEDILYVTRVGGDYFGEDTIDYNLCIVTQCDSTLMENTGACTTVVYAGINFHYRSPELPYHLNSVMMNDKMTIVATNTGMFNYDGNSFYESAPMAPGEARVALLTDGLVTGDSIKYKYCYFEYNGLDLDTSNFSCPTRAIKANGNKMVIWGFASSLEVVADSILLFRSTDGGKYEIVGRGAAGEAILDNTASTDAADTLVYEWGVFDRADANTPPELSVPGGLVYYPPPGGIVVAIDDGPSGVGILGGAQPAVQDSQSVVGYIVYYYDSIGNRSPLSVMTEIEHRTISDPGGLDTVFAYNLTIPDPDNAYIKGKVLLRYQNPYFAGLPATDSMYRRLYILDTLAIGETTFYDTFQFVDICIDARLYCEDFDMDTAGYFAVMPESTCYNTYYSAVVDSAVYFDAADITFYGFRLYAIGDLIDRNSLYYSDFGKAGTWPYDKFINIPSVYKDWLVRIVNIGESLFLFRQNSIFGMSGFSYYQYQVLQLVQGKGLASPWGLSVNNNVMYFIYSDGIWTITPNGVISSSPISLPIENVIDSINNFNLPWLGFINGELWASLPTSNDTANNITYIYSDVPTQHWKTYSIGIKDGVLHNFRSPSFNYNTTKWIFALDNDTLWRWNYTPDADTLDDTSRIISTYQSKYFFEGDDREKIHYLDLIGSGVCDSMMITFYQNYGDSIHGQGQIPIDSQLVALDWYSGDKQRVKVDHIMNNFSFKIRDYGYGQYKLRGFVIGYTPWDPGKVRPD